MACGVTLTGYANGAGRRLAGQEAASRIRGRGSADLPTAFAGEESGPGKQGTGKSARERAWSRGVDYF